jgi:hypothetical protein
MRNIATRAFLLIGIMMLAAHTLSHAQSNLASIAGTVRDASGAVIPGVTVTVVNTNTNQPKRFESDEYGNYEVVNLVPGVYRVEAELAGFKRFLHDGIQLDSAAKLRVDVRLEVGGTAETVVVESGTPAIETENASIMELTGIREHESSPVHLGDMARLMTLMPSVGQGAAKYQFSISGSRGSQNEFLIDGVATPNRSTPDGTEDIGLESVREVRIQGTNNSAEYGTPGIYQLVTRSGGNQFHFNLVYDHINSALGTRSFFDTVKPVSLEHYEQAYFSGPVTLPRLYKGRDRTFFMFSWDSFQTPLGTTLVATVPTVAMRQGDFSGVANIKDPFTGKPFPGNVIPSSYLNPVSLKFQEMFYPLPNYGSPGTLNNNQRTVMPRSPERRAFDFRIDHMLTNNNSFYVRDSFRNQPTDQWPVLATLGNYAKNMKMRGFLFSDSHTFKPTLINEFRFGYMSSMTTSFGQERSQDVINATGLTGLGGTPDDFGMPVIAITGMTSLQAQNFSSTVDRVYQVTDSVTMIKGRHTIKSGVDFRHLNSFNDVGYSSATWGSFSFQPSFTGNAYADFLLGLPKTSSIGSPTPPLHMLDNNWFLFVQDDFKIIPRLTISLGLRYEYQQPFTVTNNRLYNFNPATGQIIVQDSARGLVSPLFNPALPIAVASQAGFPNGHEGFGDRDNLAPRFGFAYRFNTKSVIRGGYGVFIDNLEVGLASSYTGGPFTPGSVAYTNSISGGVPLFQWPNAYPPVTPGPSTSAPSLNAINPHYRDPYVQQWNLTFEQEILSMGIRTSYVGTKSTQLLFSRQINRPLPSITPFNQQRRPYPLYGDIVYTENGGNSIYHALQIEANRRFSKGLSYTVGYTWASDIADVSDSGLTGGTIENPLDRAAERARESYNIRHRMMSSFIWELPFGQGRRLLSNLPAYADRILGGWKLSGVLYLQTGTWFTPTFSGSDPSNTNTIGGRPNRLASGQLPSNQRSIYRWFDITAFAVPSAGHFGNSGRDILETPGMRMFHAGIAKNFSLRERLVLNVEIAARNAFNHPCFAGPNTVINGTAGGTISAVCNTRETEGGREGEVRLRLSF